MTSGRFYEIINDLIDKAQSGFFPPEEVMSAADMAQMGRFASYYADFIETGHTHNALNPFRTSKVFTAADFTTVSGIAGMLVPPAGYQYPTGLILTQYDNHVNGTVYKKVPIYRDDELADALASQVRPVNANNPIAAQEGTGIRFYPNVNTYAGTLLYLRRPAVPVMAYTLQGGRKYVYNPTGSVDFEWADTHINDIIMRTLELLGVNLNAPEIVQWAAQNQASNQNPNKP